MCADVSFSALHLLREGVLALLILSSVRMVQLHSPFVLGSIRISGPQAKNVERFTILCVILAQGPCESSLYRSNFSICTAEVSIYIYKLGRNKHM